MSHCLPLHSPLVISSHPPLALLSCQLVFESPIVAQSSRPLVAPSSHLLVAPVGCCIASQRPFAAPHSHCLIVSDDCCVASRHAAISSSHRAALSSSCHYLTAPPSLHLIAPAGCWSPLVVPPSCCPLTALPSHHLAPAGCCDASCCAAISSSHCVLAGAAIKCPAATATTAATAKAAVGDGTATTVVELTIVHCLRKRQQQHNHQSTNGSTNAKML